MKLKLIGAFLSVFMFIICNGYISAVGGLGDDIPKPDFSELNKMELVHVQEYHDLNQTERYVRQINRNGLIADIWEGAPDRYNPGVDNYFVHVYVEHQSSIF